MTQILQFSDERERALRYESNLNKSNAKSLFEAARDGDIEKIRLILQDDKIQLADICLMDMDKFHTMYDRREEYRTSSTLTTYLDACNRIKSNAIEGTKLLVEHGADISLRLSSSIGPVCAAMKKAIQYDFLEVAFYLLAKGTPVPSCHGCQSVEMIQILMLHGADVGPSSNSIRTLFFTSVNNQEKQRKILDFALILGDDINAVDRNGMTALSAAAMHGDSLTVQFLCDAGASLDIPDDHGRTALAISFHSLHYGYMRRYGGPLPYADKFETYRIIRDEPKRRHDIAISLAFSMGLHPRLGAGSRFLDFDENLLRMIMEVSGLVVSGNYI